MTIHRPHQLPGGADRFPLSPKHARRARKRSTLGIGGSGSSTAPRGAILLPPPRFALERLAPYHPDVATAPYALTADQNTAALFRRSTALRKRLACGWGKLRPMRAPWPQA